MEADILRIAGGQLASNSFTYPASTGTMRGTHSGTLDGLPPTGDAFELDGVDVMTVSVEGITAVRGYFDQETFAEQWGLRFPKIVGHLPRLAVGAIRN